MRISDWSSDVCSSDLAGVGVSRKKVVPNSAATCSSTSTFIASMMCCIRRMRRDMPSIISIFSRIGCSRGIAESEPRIVARGLDLVVLVTGGRSEEHTSELQSLMRISYAVFCLKKKKHKANNQI